MSSRAFHPSVGAVRPHAVIKLGGGLITTVSDGHPVIDCELVKARARELVQTRQTFVLVHGTGTFGKPPAVKYGYLDGKLSHDRADVVAHVATTLARLELDVVECLTSAGMKPLRIPAWLLYRNNPVQLDPHVCARVCDAIANGMTPVIGGNFVLDQDGFSVCSSDVIAVDLALATSTSALVLATCANGVYRTLDQDAAIHDYLSPKQFADQVTMRRDPLDVSGGMHAKLKLGFEAVAAGITTHVIDGRVAGNLTATLACRPLSGTRLTATSTLQPMAD